jgi:mannose-6-phosphate isomerase-like protein (cupin superfamily)
MLPHKMSRPSRQAHFAGPGSGTLLLENYHTGEILRLRREQHADQVVLQIEGSLPPKREGPPMHIHLMEREEGEVISGVASASVGGKTIKVAAGEQTVFPMGVPHRWWNAEDEPLKLKGRVVPVVDLDCFLQAIFAVANAGPAGRLPLFYAAHVAYRHRRTQRLATVPMAIQRIVFPVVIFVGWLLGKYRGNDWPGAPKSCTGAPMRS